jgi:hypothetical protein
MTEQELQQLRREKWRVSGNAARTLDDARAFLESAGFCLMYPQRPVLLVPTFLGAFVGGEERLPDWQHAFADPRAKEATELMVRLLRERAAFEANLFGENNFLLSASVFPYFYALVGDRNPRHERKASVRSDESPLARDAFEVIRREGPISKRKLAQVLGGGVSPAALDHALGELWSKLLITRVDYDPGQGASWDALYRWAPEAVREGIQLSQRQALSGLVSKYLECVVAAEQQDIEDFFSHFVARSKVKEAVNALLAARELSFVTVGRRTMVQVTPPKPVRAPRERIVAGKGVRSQ